MHGFAVFITVAVAVMFTSFAAAQVLGDEPSAPPTVETPPAAAADTGRVSDETEEVGGDGEQGTVASAIAAINGVKDSANTPLDMDGDGTFTANTDGAIPYLHSGQGYDATSLTSFTHDGLQSTASDAITLVRGAITPNWP